MSEPFKVSVVGICVSMYVSESVVGICVSMYVSESKVTHLMLQMLAILENIAIGLAIGKTEATC